MAEPGAKKTVQPVRLYVKGVVMGFKRGLRNQYEHTSLLKIEHVKTKKDTAFYLGKRVCFIYTAQKEIRGSKFRTIWGRVIRHHGASGTVRAKFNRNLPPKAMGAQVRVMLYPNRDLNPTHEEGHMHKMHQPHHYSNPKLSAHGKAKHHFHGKQHFHHKPH